MKSNYKEVKICVNNSYGINLNENTFNDEFTITEDTVECKRYFVVLEEYIMWKHIFLDGNFKDTFIKIAKMLENLKEPVVTVGDTSLATISLKYSDDLIIEKKYKGSLTDNGMNDLSIELSKLIPSGWFYPDFIE